MYDGSGAPFMPVAWHKWRVAAMRVISSAIPIYGMPDMKPEPREKYDYSADALEGKGLLNEMTSEKISLLKKRIEEIEKWMGERGELNRKFIDKIDSEIFGLNKFPLYEHLDEMIELEQERRKEELEFWKDTVELKRELKEFLRRYRIGLERVKVWGDRVG